MNEFFLTDKDVSVVGSVVVLLGSNGLVRVDVFGIDCDAVGGDIDCPLWSIWFEFTFGGENGDVTPLGFVAEDERCRVTALIPLGWEAVVARVAIDGVEGDAIKSIYEENVSGNVNNDVFNEVAYSLWHQQSYDSSISYNSMINKSFQRNKEKYYSSVDSYLSSRFFTQ